MKTGPRGFTLIEALISLVVLSVGLLGAAATMLRSLGAHTEGLRRSTALNLVRDMADRLRVNATACERDAACDYAARAAEDQAHFESAANAAFPFPATAAEILFEPAIGPAAPDRYVITLRYPARLQPGATDGVELTVLMRAPVAGAG